MVDTLLNESISKAQRHYSSLFFLPSLKISLLGITFLSAIVSFSILFFYPSLTGILYGFLLWLLMLSLTFLADFTLANTVLYTDSIFVLRRISAVSLTSWLLWSIFFIIGVPLGLFIDVTFWAKIVILGFSILMTLRGVVFFSVSSASFFRLIFSIVFTPILSVIPFVVLLSHLTLFNYFSIFSYIIISSFIACLFSYIFVFFIDRLGYTLYGLSSIGLFKSFMLNWVADLNHPLENFLEKLGETKNITVNLLHFFSKKSKATIIVPFVHPGPFKNIGSSLLPSMLKDAFEKKHGGAVGVPLGILGHELDAASQVQSLKIIDKVLNFNNEGSIIKTASPFLTFTYNSITISCQVFAKTAFLSFTLSPKTTEDLPQELGNLVSKKAKDFGFDNVILINAHNSLTDSVTIDASLEDLFYAAVSCLDKAKDLKQYPFQVGASTVYPKEFSLKEGMGGGGITAIVFKIGLQKSFHVIIDGNNMISGFREKILSVLYKNGFDEGEIYTTDTHSVSAVVLGKRGYHPIGEVINQDLLIDYIIQAALKALDNSELCSLNSTSIIVPNVNVIGKDSLESLTVLVDKALNKAKNMIIPLFGVEALVLIFILINL